VRSTKFGDGYEQRVTFGLNQDAKEWALTFIVKDADADIIETFLNARAADAASFDWTPPDTATALKWVCLNWTRDLIGFNVNQIEATFRQVFEP
jgi:phage-related protein